MRADEKGELYSLEGIVQAELCETAGWCKERRANRAATC